MKMLKNRILIGTMMSSSKKSRYLYKKTPKYPKKKYQSEYISAKIYEEPKKDAKYWLEVARNADCYEKQCLIFSQERKLFWALIRVDAKNALNINPQASMGEYISTGERGEHEEERSSVNSLRADFCITKKGDMYPLGVVEYYGKKHYGDTPEDEEKARANDERKQTIMDKVGMFYHVVRLKDFPNIDKHLQDELLPKIEKALKGI